MINNGTNKKSSFFGKINMMRKLLLLVVITLLLTGTYFLVSKRKITSDEMPIAVVEELTTLQDESPRNWTPTTKVLMTKEIEGGKLEAFVLLDQSSNAILPGVYGIQLTPDFLPPGTHSLPVVYSFGSLEYCVGQTCEIKLFDVLNDNEIWAVNDQNRKVDIFKITSDKQINYNRSIGLPNYQLGDFYGIECGANACTLYTAFHLESGCTLKLNLSDDSFTDINCTEPLMLE